VSEENLTSFCGRRASVPSSPRACACDGIIFDIRKRNPMGRKEFRRLDREVARDVEVEVDMDVSDDECAVAEGVEYLEDDDFFIADLAGGGGLVLDLFRRPVLSYFTSSEEGMSSELGRVEADLTGRRCGVRERCRPIAICSTVGTKETPSPE